MKHIASFALLFIIPICVAGQESQEKKKTLLMNGYIKSLSSLTIENNINDVSLNTLIHNRINLKWKLSENFQFVGELRNRVFWGDDVQKTLNFSSALRNLNEGINLQKIWIKEKNMVGHSNLDRLYMNFKKNKWGFRIGRQRVNWSMANTWNPNDIFNSYNFLDFDYEERPGADAIKTQYLLDDFSQIELVYSKISNSKNIFASRYFLNKWKYDFQIISGRYKEKYTIGLGWAGNIAEVGFRGESQYYFKSQNNPARLNICTELDHLLEKGWYLQVGALYNSIGLTKPINQWETLNLNLSPENMMPGRWSMISGFRKEITPLLSVQTNIVYSPGPELLLLLPSATYSITENIDADMIWQSFFVSLNNAFQEIKHLGFIRCKWSF